MSCTPTPQYLKILILQFYKDFVSPSAICKLTPAFRVFVGRVTDPGPSHGRDSQPFPVTLDTHIFCLAGARLKQRPTTKVMDMLSRMKKRSPKTSINLKEAHFQHYNANITCAMLIIMPNIAFNLSVLSFCFLLPSLSSLW